MADDIDVILGLKRQSNAGILLQNYQAPEIFHCVAEIPLQDCSLAAKLP
ncbi:hypothetical protein NKI20_32835 [Mesorhizobium sp. M0830]